MSLCHNSDIFSELRVYILQFWCFFSIARKKSDLTFRQDPRTDMRTETAHRKSFTAAGDGDRVYSSHKSIVLPRKTWNINTFWINVDGSCICQLYLVFYWQMVGLGAGVGLRAHKCVNNINKTVVTVYIEKSHPNIYAAMAIL